MQKASPHSLLRPARSALARLERAYGPYGPRRAAVAKAEQAVEKARCRGGKHAGRSPSQRYRRAREAAERVVEEYCRLGDLLEQASNDSLTDEVEIVVIRLVDRAIRSSSSVECVHARTRRVQVARKRLSEDFVCLLAVYHNLKPLGRGSVRAGRSPAELARLQLPTSDWIELLELTAAESVQAAQAAA